MPLPRLALSVIGDEIGPTLDEMLSFCAEEGVRRLEIRTVQGRNLLGMALPEIERIAARVRAAGLDIPTFVSPVLKWPAPGRAPRVGRVDFAFDPAQCPSPDPIAYAFDVSRALGARRLRIFSHLTYDGYAPSDLAPQLDRLCALAETHDMSLQLENEPVCNVATLADLSRALAAFPHPRLHPLVDIANAVAHGAPPDDAELRAVAPRTDHIHLKDWDPATRRTVPLGDGAVDFARRLAVLLPAVGAPAVLASIETHVPRDGRNATRRNVAAVRALARGLGAEID